MMSTAAANPQVQEPPASAAARMDEKEKLRRDRLEQFSNELQEHVAWNQRIESPTCACLGPNYQYDENKEGPYYTHLGAGPSVAAIRRVMESRSGLSGPSLRIEKLCFTAKEGKSAEGCPVAKWVIRRSSFEEKLLVLARHRPGHRCPNAWIVVGIVCWDGLDSSIADDLYDYLRFVLPGYGEETERRCGINEDRTCACQGLEPKSGGASYSFGCSWSMYNNACKFARTKGSARKFRLKDASLEEELEKRLQNLASMISPLYRRLGPDAFLRQTEFEGIAANCRLGTQAGRPFAGVTTSFDYCTHAHKDQHNMNNGCTVVVSLCRHRGLSRPDDEQLHVLPLYILDSTDEWWSTANQWRKVEQGQIEMLTSFPRLTRMRGTALSSCNARKKAKREARIEAMKAGGGAAERTTPGANGGAKSRKSKCGKQQQQQPPKQQNKTKCTKTNKEGDDGEVEEDEDNHLPSLADWFGKPINDYWDLEGSLLVKQEYDDHSLVDIVAESWKFANSGGDSATLVTPLATPADDDPLKFPFPTTPDPFTASPGSENKKPGETGGGATGTAPGVDREYWSQNEDIFLDPEVGGVGIALPHGSVYFQVSKREMHATTSLHRPSRAEPSRISLVFYQHKNLHFWHHGCLEWERKKSLKKSKAMMVNSNNSDKPKSS